jgi:pentose-5-phosphate-3-epimerase
MHTHVLKIVIWQKLYVDKMLRCSVCVKIDGTERALNLKKMATKTADWIVSGSYDFVYKYNI